MKTFFRKKFWDERERKPFLVGLAVFIVVFTGLMIYQQSIKEQGDVIITNDGTEYSQEYATEPGNYGQGGLNTDGDEAANMGGTDYGYAEPVAEQTVIFVDVGGAVNINGLFALSAGSRVEDAIMAAGGLREDADLRYINRAAELKDGDRLYIPTESEVKNGTAPPSAGQVTEAGGYSGSSSPIESGGGAAANANSQVGSLININTANSEELQKLNGVGPVTAQKIIDYRTKYGGFKRIEELMNVNGIGVKTFEKLQDHIVV